MGTKLHFRVHTTNLLKEIVDNSLTVGKNGVLFVPINQLRVLLCMVAERAAEINDPKLNALMIRMTLYEVADPESNEYNREIVNEHMKLLNKNEQTN